mgnify:CR=1 FL=1
MGKWTARLLLLLAFWCSIPAVGFSMPENQSPVYPGGREWQPGEARYGVQIVRDLFITMDDGAVLEARLAYPTDVKTGERSTEQFPVLVEFTPYEDSNREQLRHTFLTEHGYIVALVHPRGSGKSSGILEQFTSRDGLDGKAVVDWAAKLEGSNGKVGFFGASYPGALSLATAAKVGKDSLLKAVLAPASVLVRSIARHGRTTAWAPF